MPTTSEFATNGRTSAMKLLLERRSASAFMVEVVAIGMASIGMLKAIQAIAPRVKIAIAPKITAPATAVVMAAFRPGLVRRATQSAIDGISGRMYCGRLDWDSEKKTN